MSLLVQSEHARTKELKSLSTLETPSQLQLRMRIAFCAERAASDSGEVDTAFDSVAKRRGRPGAKRDRGSRSYRDTWQKAAEQGKPAELPPTRCRDANPRLRRVMTAHTPTF
jgi:hypothetical protein